MKTLQATPRDYSAHIAQAQEWHCEAIAWTLSASETSADNALLQIAIAATRQAGLRPEGWLQAARDPLAADAHTEWLHCPQHHEWLNRFPDYTGGHPGLVAPYIGLNTRAAFDHALLRAESLVRAVPGIERCWLADIQGAPMGCGCGNPCCRSWDNAPGSKLAPTPYEQPELLFPLAFFDALRSRLPKLSLTPVLCPECERGVSLDGVEDPDGPEGTDLCQGIPCVRPCALDYWPRLLATFRSRGEPVGLLLLTNALGKNHPIFGPPRAWASRAHRHYGADLIACVEPEDEETFSNALIVTDAPQDCFPVAPPSGYRAEVPPIMCGYCPPEPS